jgi:hypothetical protein
MQEARKGSELLSGFIKFVFILCYIAFMWASIHHVATYFGNFEANGSDVVGSYLLAGAFDVTALVTTIGVMFFRKNMPRHVQWIIWAFIIALAGYSMFINWEYAMHYQNSALILQPTGATTAVYDSHGVLHYVPVMRENTVLLFLNPILASGFTIFSLIYSIIAEFFGTKLPSVDELKARKEYLEETVGLNESIKQLEGKSKGKGIIQTAKEKALEMKNAAAEVLSTDENTVKEDSLLEQETDQEGETETVETTASPVSHPAPARETEYETVSTFQTPAYEVEPETERETFEASFVSPQRKEAAGKLGFVESAMYDRLTANYSVLAELVAWVQQVTMPELVQRLQSRFSSHASFITSARVQTVLEEVQRNYPEMFGETERETETDQDAESFSESFIDTDERETVQVQFPISETPHKRITVKLTNVSTDQQQKPERNTDKLPPTGRGNKKPASGETDTIKKIRTMVKRNPNIDAPEIAKRAGITPQYARKVKKQILSEMTA